MRRDHTLDFDGPAVPAARGRRHSFRVMDSPAEDFGQGTADIAPALVREKSIAAQAWNIIETVLADSDPSLADVQRRLRQNVANHPGSPSGALLAHLLETRRRSSSES